MVAQYFLRRLDESTWATRRGTRFPKKDLNRFEGALGSGRDGRVDPFGDARFNGRLLDYVLSKEDSVFVKLDLHELDVAGCSIQAHLPVHVTLPRRNLEEAESEQMTCQVITPKKAGAKFIPQL